MIINPIIPIWLMSVLCVIMLVLKRKGIFPYIRQVIIVLLLFAINLRPMLPGEGRKTGEKTMDVQVLFVIDDTISMLAEDYNGSGIRLEAVKKDCEYIINKLEGARFSVISFHNSANLLSPYTNNYEHTINTINAIYPIEDMYARGSSLNTPRELSCTTLQHAREKKSGKVILFFISDGEITNNSTLESYSELKQYVDGGAVLGYGTPEGGKMHLVSPYTGDVEEIMDNSDYPAKPALSKYDEANLQQIAGDIGIDYVHMTEQNKVDSVIDDIKNNATVTVQDDGENESTKDVEGAKDIYYFFAIPLLLILIFEAFLMLRKK